MSGFNNDCTSINVIWFWRGGREVGEWKPSNRGAGTVGADLTRLNRAGYVAIAGNYNMGAPEGPPSDAKFRAIGM